MESEEEKIYENWQDWESDRDNWWKYDKLSVAGVKPWGPGKSFWDSTGPVGIENPGSRIPPEVLSTLATMNDPGVDGKGYPWYVAVKTDWERVLAKALGILAAQRTRTHVFKSWQDWEENKNCPEAKAAERLRVAGVSSWDKGASFWSRSLKDPDLNDHKVPDEVFTVLQLIQRTNYGMHVMHDDADVGGLSLLSRALKVIAAKDRTVTLDSWSHWENTKGSERLAGATTIKILGAAAWPDAPSWWEPGARGMETKGSRVPSEVLEKMKTYTLQHCTSYVAVNKDEDPDGTRLLSRALVDLSREYRDAR